MEILEEEDEGFEEDEVKNDDSNHKKETKFEEELVSTPPKMNALLQP